MTITEKFTIWIESEYKSCITYHSNPHEALTRSYGVVMFAINMLLKYDSEEAKIIENWWDNEMLPKFRELEERR